MATPAGSCTHLGSLLTPTAASLSPPPLSLRPSSPRRSCDPLELVRLPFGAGAEPLYFVLVNPLFEAPTKQMRAVLPRDVPFKSMIHNSTQGGALVAAILQGGSRVLWGGCAAGEAAARWRARARLSAGQWAGAGQGTRRSCGPVAADPVNTWDTTLHAARACWAARWTVAASPRPSARRWSRAFAPLPDPTIPRSTRAPPTNALSGNARLLGCALDSDCIVEPVRAPLIPRLAAAEEAAKAAGAYGCTISGAGPTAVAVVSDPGVGARVADAMAAAFRSEGKLEINSKKVVRLDPEGAKFV